MDDWEETTTTLEHELHLNAKMLSPNRWVGEDVDEEEEHVKDSWEDDDEDDNAVAVVATPPVNHKHKSAEKIKVDNKKHTKVAKVPIIVLSPKTSKTCQTKQSAEAKQTPIKDTTPKNATVNTDEHTDEAGQTNGLNTLNDLTNPTTEKDFKELASVLSWKISQYKDETFFDEVMENILGHICSNMTALDIKKIKGRVEKVHAEKLRSEKQERKQQQLANVAKNGAKVVPAKPKSRRKSNDFSGYGTFETTFDDAIYDDMYDFM